MGTRSAVHDRQAARTKSNMKAPLILESMARAHGHGWIPIQGTRNAYSSNTHGVQSREQAERLEGKAIQLEEKFTSFNPVSYIFSAVTYEGV